MIRILDSQLDGRVSTGGGGGLVRNVTGNLKATSGGGLVKYENVRDKQGDFRGPGDMSADGVTSGTIIYSLASGGIDLNEAPEGAKVKTGGGSIDIRRAEHFVEATTGGGDIEIEIKDGIDLRTGHGEVTIIVHADASMDFDIDLGYNRSSSRNFDIASDFDLDIEHTIKWKKERGRDN